MTILFISLDHRLVYLHTEGAAGTHIQQVDINTKNKRDALYSLTGVDPFFRFLRIHKVQSPLGNLFIEVVSLLGPQTSSVELRILFLPKTVFTIKCAVKHSKEPTNIVWISSSSGCFCCCCLVAFFSTTHNQQGKHFTIPHSLLRVTHSDQRVSCCR